MGRASAKSRSIVVDGYVVTDPDDPDELNLRDDVWAFALDQRAFGPRKLVVAFADDEGRLLGLAHTRRIPTPERALGPCIEHIGLRVGAQTAIAYCDERVAGGPPPHDTGERFATAVAIANAYGIRLVDWIACDDQMFRSSRLALLPEDHDDVAEVWWSG